jgi:hypothetical protein
VDAVDVREIAVRTGVGERALLGDGLLLLGGSVVCQRIGAGVVVVGIAAKVDAEVGDGAVGEGASPTGGEVDGCDLGALVAVTDGVGVLIGDAEVLVIVGRLEPGTCVLRVEVERVPGSGLQVDAVEEVGFVALVMEDGELGRIEKAAGVKAVGGDEVAPVLATVGEVDRQVRGAEGAVAGADVACGCGVLSPYSAGGAPSMTSRYLTAAAGTWLEKTLLCWSVMGWPSMEKEFSA